MDYAMVRSCRIDYKLELGYADEYQTKNIYDLHSYRNKVKTLVNFIKR